MAGSLPSWLVDDIPPKVPGAPEGGCLEEADAVEAEVDKGGGGGGERVEGGRELRSGMAVQKKNCPAAVRSVLIPSGAGTQVTTLEVRCSSWCSNPVLRLEGPNVAGSW